MIWISMALRKLTRSRTEPQSSNHRRPWAVDDRLNTWQRMVLELFGTLVGLAGLAVGIFDASVCPGPYSRCHPLSKGQYMSLRIKICRDDCGTWSADRRGNGLLGGNPAVIRPSRRSMWNPGLVSFRQAATWKARRCALA
jgi:hypothetical protein